LSKRFQESESELRQAEIQIKLKDEEQRKELDVMKENMKRRVEEASKRGTADSGALAELER
jgi:hypothetical protein